jgi:RNA polymerase sigma factor (sigma-70 family)
MERTAAGQDVTLPGQRLSEEEVSQLYNRHGPALLLYARSYVVDVGAAEDVVHRVFLRMLSGNYLVTENAAAYLYRSIRNEAMNDRRSRSRETPLVEDRGWFSSDRAVDALVLQRAIADLPEEQRDVVVMRIWSGMTFEEMAEATGVSVHTAASRYRYGLAKLRDRLGARQGSEGLR